jgi:hypothetical protein
MSKKVLSRGMRGLITSKRAPKMYVSRRSVTISCGPDRRQMAERRVIAKRAESAGDFSNRDRNAATHTDADAEQDRKNGRGTDSGARKEVENCVPEAHEAQYAANGGIGRGYERNGLLVRNGLRPGILQRVRCTQSCSGSERFQQCCNPRGNARSLHSACRSLREWQAPVGMTMNRDDKV